MLTKLVGDCMFESLIYHGIGRSVESLRKGIAFIMYIYKDYKNFFLTQETPLSELFSMWNEVEYVRCVQPPVLKAEFERVKAERIAGNMHAKPNIPFPKYYKYTYEVMCQDLTCQYNWSKLPTELLLLVISLIYQIEITIVNVNIHKDEESNEEKVNMYEHNISAFENVPIEKRPATLRKVYLGHLGESHYIPMDAIVDEKIKIAVSKGESIGDHMKLQFYNESKERFIQWAKFMEAQKYMHFFREQERKADMQRLASLRISSLKVDTESIVTKESDQMVISEGIETKSPVDSLNNNNNNGGFVEIDINKIHNQGASTGALNFVRQPQEHQEHQYQGHQYQRHGEMAYRI